MQLKENVRHSNVSHYSHKNRSKVAKDAALKAVKRASHQEPLASLHNPLYTLRLHDITQDCHIT